MSKNRTLERLPPYVVTTVDLGTNLYRPRRCGCVRSVVAIMMWLLTCSTMVAAEDFTPWLRQLRAEARKVGVSAMTLEQTLGDIRPLPYVLRAQNRQPESRLSWAQYRSRVVSLDRQLRGRQQATVHAQQLQAIAARYGVQARFIIALWGIESDYGRNTGDVPVVAALATIAHGGRRRDYFRRELIELLRAVDTGQTPPGVLTGSWAGALGQCQFMPSNYRRYAVDADGDGRRDIWGSQADIFASIARFLASLGWKDDETWGRPVSLPGDIDPRLFGLEVKMRLARWQALGVRRLDGRNLPRRSDLWTNLVAPDGQQGETFLVYNDFHALMRWNRSTHFALAVGVLADAVAPALRP